MTGFATDGPVGGSYRHHRHLPAGHQRSDLRPGAAGHRRRRRCRHSRATRSSGSARRHRPRPPTKRSMPAGGLCCRAGSTRTATWFSPVTGPPNSPPGWPGGRTRPAASSPRSPPPGRPPTPNSKCCSAGRIREMLAGGTTCIETKTGYGSDHSGRSSGRPRSRLPAGADAVTFLGAHVNAPEFARIPTAISTWSADRCSTPSRRTCSSSTFSARRVPSTRPSPGAYWPPGSARAWAQGARQPTGRRGRASASRWTTAPSRSTTAPTCPHRDVDLLGGSSTVATLLPLCDLSTRQPPAPGRRLADAGATIAIASNCNPGSCYTPSMSLAVALAVLQCGLTADEAVYAATVGGARALARSDVGVIAAGKRADLHVLNAPSHDYLAYRVGLAARPPRSGGPARGSSDPAVAVRRAEIRSRRIRLCPAHTVAARFRRFGADFRHFCMREADQSGAMGQSSVRNRGAGQPAPSSRGRPEGDS